MRILSTTPVERAPVRLALAEDPLTAGQAAPWIGPMLALGSRASRFSAPAGRQLVVVLSVPRRDFAAVLIASGWVLAQPAPPPVRAAIDAVRDLEPGALVRVVTEREVILDRFVGLNDAIDPPRMYLSRSQWFTTRIRGVAVVDPHAANRLSVWTDHISAR